MTARLAGLAALLLLAGCEASRPSVAPSPAAAAITTGTQTADGCTGAGESLTVRADRGIGGTGVGGEAPVVADRGIGGTGVTGEPGVPGDLSTTQSAERGGGGTGIVGVLTGFRSLCVDGVEVALDRPARVTVDGEGRAEETLLVGEVAEIAAQGAANDLHAVSIGIRHEVSGPITALAAAGDAIEVAGQRVLISPQTRVAGELRPGGWVAVSGLRDPAGAIRATRLDQRAPGEVLVAGVPEQVAGGWVIGGLRLLLPPKPVAGAGRLLLAGDYADGVLRVREISDDPVLPMREKLGRMLVEAYPSVEGQAVRLAQGIEADLGPGFGAAPPADRLIILELVNSPADALTAVSWHLATAVGGHGKPVAAPDSAAPSAPASPMQTPAAPAAVAPPVATIAPPATTTTPTTTTTVPAAIAATTTTTAVAATTAVTATTSTTAATPPSSADAPSQSAPTTGAGGGDHTVNGAADQGAGSGGSGGSGPASSTPTQAAPTHPPPPPSIGEGPTGPTSPPTRGAGAEGGSDGPPGVTTGRTGVPGGGTGGAAGRAGTGGAGNGTNTGGGTGATGGGTGAGTGSGSGSGPGTAPGGGVGGGEQGGGKQGGGKQGGGKQDGGKQDGGKPGGGKKGAGTGAGIGNGRSDDGGGKGKEGGKGHQGGKDGNSGNDGKGGGGKGPGPSPPSHGANNG